MAPALRGTAEAVPFVEALPSFRQKPSAFVGFGIEQMRPWT